jgi:hypothetical protein
MKKAASLAKPSLDEPNSELRETLTPGTRNPSHEDD